MGDQIAQLVLEQISTLAVVKVLDFNTMPSSPNTPDLETADFERSPWFEIEDATPQRTSLNPPTPRVWLPVNQIVGDCNPCPETWTRPRRSFRRRDRPLLSLCFQHQATLDSPRQSLVLSASHLLPQCPRPLVVGEPPSHLCEGFGPLVVHFLCLSAIPSFLLR